MDDFVVVRSGDYRFFVFASGLAAPTTRLSLSCWESRWCGPSMDERQYHLAVEAVKELNRLELPLKEQKFAGWEGRFTPLKIHSHSSLNYYRIVECRDLERG